MENIRAVSDINGYFARTQNTIVTMKNVEISGYSNANPTDKGGGALRIQSADYTSLNHTQTNPTLESVLVENCCRAIRLQDCVGAYVYNCTVRNITDNALYWANGGQGCQGCTFDTCTGTNCGNNGIVMINVRDNCLVKNCTIDTTRGTGLYFYTAITGTVIVEDTTFINVNTSETTTPFNGSTDDAHGAAVGFSLDADAGTAIVQRCTFTSSGNNDSVFWKANANGTLDVSTGNTYAGNSFGGGVVDANSVAVTGSGSVVNSDGGTASGDPYFVPMLA